MSFKIGQLSKNNFYYEAGSFESLKRMVDLNDGITVLPELAITDFSATHMQQIKPIKTPVPVREVSIVVHRNIVKKRLIEALKNSILENIPEKIKRNKNTNIIPIEQIALYINSTHNTPKTLVLLQKIFYGI